MPADPRDRQVLPDRSISVRVAPEILAHMKTGTVEPVVILGVQDCGDGTYDMTLMTPEIVVELDDLKAENERLREALAGDVSAIYHDCGACLGGGKPAFHPCEWCAENRRTDAAKTAGASDEEERR